MAAADVIGKRESFWQKEEINAYRQAVNAHVLSVSIHHNTIEPSLEL
jgi:hypothetical protein